MIELLTLLAVVSPFLLLIGLESVTLSTAISGYINSQQTVTVTDSTGLTANPTILAAQPGTLTTRTNNTAGTLTMNSTNHGIITGQRIDLYWNGGQAYDATAGTVSGNSVPFNNTTGGSVLVANNSLVTVGIPISTAFSLTGNNLSALVCVAQQAGYFVFNDGTNDAAPQYVLAGQSYSWFTGSGVTNPLASVNPTKVWMSTSYQVASVTGNQSAALAH